MGVVNNVLCNCDFLCHVLSCGTRALVVMFIFVFPDAPDVNTAIWPPQTIAGNLPPHIARPWVDTTANPAIWLGQGEFNVPRPTDTTQLPLAPHTELKLVQHPITGRLYIIPSRTLCSYYCGSSFIINHNKKVTLHFHVVMI